MSDASLACLSFMQLHIGFEKGSEGQLCLALLGIL